MTFRNIIWAACNNVQDNVIVGRTEEGFTWMGEPVSEDLLNEVQAIMTCDNMDGPHPGHSRMPTTDQMNRARAVLTARQHPPLVDHNNNMLADVLQSAGASAEEAGEGVRQLSRIGGFVIERPQTVRETMEGLAVVYNFSDEEEFMQDLSAMPGHVRQIEELERERYENASRSFEYNDDDSFADILTRVVCAPRDFVIRVINMVTKPMRDHRARVKEQARLDALPNPWRNPRRKVRV